jgi:hypothetical protein
VPGYYGQQEDVQGHLATTLPPPCAWPGPEISMSCPSQYACCNGVTATRTPTSPNRSEPRTRRQRGASVPPVSSHGTGPHPLVVDHGPVPPQLPVGARVGERGTDDSVLVVRDGACAGGADAGVVRRHRGVECEGRGRCELLELTAGKASGWRWYWTTCTSSGPSSKQSSPTRWRLVGDCGQDRRDSAHATPIVATVAGTNP